ncbi:MAG TPA: discoidin domain-containing protein, partial [Verrucomicrobiae bacterium]
MKNLLRILALMCAFFCVSKNASAATAIVNVAMDGIAAANQPVYTGQSPNWLIDGSKDAGNVVHGQAALDPGFAFTIDLQKDYSVSDIKVYPRQNACCPDRLSNFRVSLHADDGAGGMGAEIWGTDLFTDGSNPGSGAGKVVDVVLPETKVGRWIEIRSLANPVPQYALQMSEVEVFATVDASQVNRAINAIVTANQPLYGTFTPSMLVDGNRESVIHGQAGLSPGFAYTVDLGLEVTMDHINVIPRQDGCCPSRLTNYRLSVFKDNNGAPGDQVYSIDLHTDQSDPGSTFGSRDVINATVDPAFAGVKGQWVKIESLDDPIADYALQIAELEVYGTLPAIVKLQILSQPQDVSTGIGSTATFSVNANALGGDNSLITYQWLVNGNNLQGETNATLTLSGVALADADQRFSVVVSYPGQPSQTSTEARLS